jgi:hypothetical protein
MGRTSSRAVFENQARYHLLPVAGFFSAHRLTETLRRLRNGMR